MNEKSEYSTALFLMGQMIVSKIIDKLYFATALDSDAAKELALCSMYASFLKNNETPIMEDSLSIIVAEFLDYLKPKYDRLG